MPPNVLALSVAGSSNATASDRHSFLTGHPTQKRLPGLGLCVRPGNICLSVAVPRHCVSCHQSGLGLNRSFTVVLVLVHQ